MKIQSRYMQYPNILSRIDAELDRLQRARTLLLSVPPTHIRTPAERQGLRRQSRVKPASTASPAAPPVSSPSSAVAVIAQQLPTAVQAAVPLSTAAPQQPKVVVVRKKSEPKRVVRMKKQMRGETSALRSAAPPMPVAVSAVEAQRQRVLTQEMRDTGAAKSAKVPELSAEMLAQRWLRKGPTDTQFA